MGTSPADKASQGMEVLYSLHPLNVATSRARNVATAALRTPDCRPPGQMRLANPFCPLPRVGAASSRNPEHDHGAVTVADLQTHFVPRPEVADV